MSTESLNRTSADIVTPSYEERNPKVNVDVLKHRILVQKKKDRLKKTIIFSGIFLSLSVLTFLTN